MNEIIKPEAAVTIFGVPARTMNVIADPDNGHIANQSILASRHFEEDGGKYQIIAKLRFDDGCKNGHESFAITGDLRRFERGSYRLDSSGCIHEEIAKHFPEFAHLIKWHLTSTDGPLHYEANTIYLAGNLDSSRRAAGEPLSFSYGVRFGNSPITYKLNKNFYDWLDARKEFLDALNKSGSGKNNPENKPFAVEEVPHPDVGKPGKYQFDPKCTLEGFDCKWHECPFDNKTEADEFAKAINTLPVEFVIIPTAFSKGKDRELDSARRSAVWPDATDEELSQEPEALRAALRARLPALLEAFKVDMLSCGYVWPEHKVPEGPAAAENGEVASEQNLAAGKRRGRAP